MQCKCFPAHSPSCFQRCSQPCVPGEWGMLSFKPLEPNAAVRTRLWRGKTPALGTAILVVRFYSDWKLNRSTPCLTCSGPCCRSPSWTLGGTCASSAATRLNDDGDRFCVVRHSAIDLVERLGRCRAFRLVFPRETAAS